MKKKKDDFYRAYDKHDEILAKDKVADKQVIFIGQDSPPVATLIFPLPEYEADFKCAQDGWKYKAVLEELQNEMRSVYKHGNNRTAEKYARIWSDRLLELVNERDLTIV